MPSNDPSTMNGPEPCRFVAKNRREIAHPDVPDSEGPDEDGEEDHRGANRLLSSGERSAGRSTLRESGNSQVSPTRS